MVFLKPFHKFIIFVNKFREINKEAAALSAKLSISSLLSSILLTLPGRQQINIMDNLSAWKFPEKNKPLLTILNIM